MRPRRVIFSLFITLCLWITSYFFIFQNKNILTKNVLRSLTMTFFEKTNWNTLRPHSTLLPPNERLKQEIGIQKCRIPTFDALHPQILPYVNLSVKEPTPLRRKGRIENGALKLKLKGLSKATICYIRRVEDFKFKLSKEINLLNEENQASANCIQSEDLSCVLEPDEAEGESGRIPLWCRNGPCRDIDDEDNDDAFIFRAAEGKIFHMKTGKCLQSVGCIEPSVAYDFDEWIKIETDINSAQDCQSHCMSNEKCTAWTFNKRNEICHLKDKIGERIFDKEEYLSGPKICKNETFPDLHLVEEDKCDPIWSNFRYNRLTGTLEHVATSTCVSVDTTTKVVLFDCQHFSSQLKLPKKGSITIDQDISYPLTEEFIQLEYENEEGDATTEYLSHVIEKKLKFNATKRRNDEELNILMILFDSQSNKNIQRQFKRTYRYLRSHPQTVLLHNHVITGDGTTANLAPMLAGKHVIDLPEARPMFSKSQYLDKWPLIFKDFQKQGYVTLFGDDDPINGAFHYRLTGFDKQPTDKYLLPYFFSTKCDYETCHQYAFDYLQKFMDTYRSYKHFSFMSLGLGHEEIDQIGYGDSHTYSFVKSILKDKRHRNNTAIFVFGDHGHRTAKIRETIWGKLEERLPFMSLTFPPWFFEKYKESISMLKLNSHVMTSQFDIHQTLLHLLHPGTYNPLPRINTTNATRVTFGESLFTNIAASNRTCDEAGVPLHFCPCKEYRPAPKNDSLVIKMCNETVFYINKMVKNSMKTNSTLCVELQLKDIIRARTAAPSEKVQKYEETYSNNNCDRCGIKENKDFEMKVTQYELVFSVEPSQGIYEATVEYLLDTETIRVNPDISRVNRYGEQPKCIANQFPHLRKFCFCKDFSTKYG